MQYSEEERLALYQRVKALETELLRAREAERMAMRRAELLEQSNRTAWRLSVAGRGTRAVVKT